MEGKQALINENETFADIYDSFFWHYYNDDQVPLITRALIYENRDIIRYSEDYNHFWYAIAKAQWECKALSKSVFKKVSDIIENGHDIALLKKVGFSDKTLNKRAALLSKFLNILRTERNTAKSRTRPYKRPAFKKGDCLAFKLDNGNYGGAVVLEADYRDGLNLLAITNINKPRKPKKLDFKSAKVLVQTFGSWNMKPALHGYESTFHFKYVNLYEIIDNILVKKKYDIDSRLYGIAGSFKAFVIDIANLQFKHMLDNKAEISRLTILEYIK